MVKIKKIKIKKEIPSKHSVSWMWSEGTIRDLSIWSPVLLVPNSWGGPSSYRKAFRKICSRIPTSWHMLAGLTGMFLFSKSAWFSLGPASLSTLP